MPVQLNTNENPYPLPEPLVERSPSGVARGRARPQPLPRPGRGRAAHRAGRVPHPDRQAPIAPENVWAANGSNEVIQQLLQTFGGPGRTAIGFEPSYSMHRAHLPRHRHRLDLRPAQRRLHHRPRGGRAGHRRDTGPTSSSSPRPTTPPAPRSTPRRSSRCTRPRRRRAVAGRGRRGVRASSATGDSLLPLIEGRPNLVVSRTMSKAFGARRAAPRLSRRAPGGRATPSSSYGCRTTCPPSPRRPRCAALEHTDYAAGVRRAAEARSGTGWSSGLRAIGSRSPNRTPTSSSSAGSPTGTRPGRRSSTGASWSVTTACRDGCGSPPGRPKRTTRSSTRFVS